MKHATKVIKCNIIENEDSSDTVIYTDNNALCRHNFNIKKWLQIF